MKCQEVKDLMFAYVKGELDEKTRSAVKSHLDVCETCRKEVDDVRAVLALIESASDEKIIDMVNKTILEATRSGASDIHIEAEPDGMRVRVRRDGVLHDLTRLPAEAKPAVAARIKMMADMNVSERRIPQDGRISSAQLPAIDRKLDFRVSCTPTIHGESFVMKVLDRSNVLLGLDNLEISPEQLSRIRSLMHRQQGMIIVTGPTGSGKTTLLYSMLLSVNRDELKLVTVEDPVEYALKGATQIQVSKKAGLTFAAGLRSMRRHDPDILMVGEMRDLDTAETAIAAAITGHVVLSTLHTSDAPSALVRLVDMGAEPFIVTSAVAGVLAQRLVRKICSDCREEYSPNSEALEALGFTQSDIRGAEFYHGRGCEKCSGTGYVGRTPLMEVLVMNPDIARLLNSRAPLIDIRSSAITQGMITIGADARRKIADGITTVEEAARVLGIDLVG